MTTSFLKKSINNQSMTQSVSQTIHRSIHPIIDQSVIDKFIVDLRVPVSGRGVRTVLCGLGHSVRHSRALSHQEHRLVHVPEAGVGV